MASQRRAERRQVKQRQILTAAMAIVLERGIEGLTMPRLAEEIESAVGGLYRYYPSKDHLIAALDLMAVDAFADHLEARLDGWAPADTGNPQFTALSHIWRAIDSWFTFASEHPELYQLMSSFISAPKNVLDDPTDAQMQLHVGPILTTVVTALDRALAAGTIAPGDALLRTHVLWGVLHGIAHFRKMDARRPETLHAQALADRAVTDLLVGWGAPAAPIATARELARA